jgi:hypothetical protein
VLDPSRPVPKPAPRVRGTDPATSVAAAVAAGERLTGHRWLVLCALVAAGDRGLTDFEYEREIGLKQTSAGVRRGELAAVGYCARTGTTRPSDTGTAADVWAVTDLGRQAWRTEDARRDSAA